jgi:hypothetical protein
MAASIHNSTFFFFIAIRFNFCLQMRRKITVFALHKRRDTRKCLGLVGKKRAFWEKIAIFGAAPTLFLSKSVVAITLILLWHPKFMLRLKDAESVTSQ